MTFESTLSLLSQVELLRQSLTVPGFVIGRRKEAARQ
jgi:hypothetical protein